MDFQEFVKKHATIDLATAQHIASEGYYLIHIVNGALQQGLNQESINKLLDNLFGGSGKFSVANNMSRLIWFITQSAFDTGQSFGRGGVVLDTGNEDTNKALFHYFQTSQSVAYPRASSHMSQYRQDDNCMGIDIDVVKYENNLINNQYSQLTHKNSVLIPLPIQRDVKHPFVTVNFILVNESGMHRVYFKAETAPWNPSKNPFGSLRHATNYIGKKLSPKNVDGLDSKREDNSETIEAFISLRKEIAEDLTKKYIMRNTSLSNLSSKSEPSANRFSWVSTKSKKSSSSSLTNENISSPDEPMAPLRRSLSDSLFKFSGNSRKTKLNQILRSIETAKSFDNLIKSIKEMRDEVRSSLKGGSDRSLMYMRPLLDAIKKTEELKHRLSSPNLHGNEVRLLVDLTSGKVSCGDSHTSTVPKTAFFKK